MHLRVVKDMMNIILIRLTILLWYESNINEEFSSNVLLLLQIIFVRDESFFVTINDAPFCTCHDLVR